MPDFRQMINFRKCEDLDPDGGHELLCFRGLSFDAQDALFRSVFAEGCEGECGGLMTQEERAKWKAHGPQGKYTVESCHGQNWHVQSDELVALDDMGFHGRIFGSTYVLFALKDIGGQSRNPTNTFNLKNGGSFRERFLSRPQDC